MTSLTQQLHRFYFLSPAPSFSMFFYFENILHIIPKREFETKQPEQKKN